MKITEQMLGVLVKRINTVTGSPEKPCINNGEGYFYIDYACGGVGLRRMVSADGGATLVFGYGTKRELYLQMTALLRGIEFAKQGV